MTMPKVPVIPDAENHRNQALLMLNATLQCETSEDATVFHHKAQSLTRYSDSSTPRSNAKKV